MWTSRAIWQSLLRWNEIAQCPKLRLSILLKTTLTIGDKVVGFVHYRLQPSALRDTQILYLDDLFVTETHRGSGVADDIMDRLREIAQDHSCSAIRWDTHTTNERARRFHERYAKNTNWVTYEMSTNSK